jgi:hypothetical protein
MGIEGYPKMEYRISYLSQIISRAFLNSFGFLGIGSQVIIDLVFYIYYQKTSSHQLGDFMMGVYIVIGAFLVIFFINLIWEFKWVLPNINITARRQLMSNGKLMVVFDIYNNEPESLTECYLKLNKFTVFYLDNNDSKNTVPKNILEKFDWQSEEDRIEIPSLENRTVNIAQESPELSDSDVQIVYGPAIRRIKTQEGAKENNSLLGLCTDHKRIIFPDMGVSNNFFVVLLKFEAELRGIINKKRMFPQKVYGSIIFKRTGVTNSNNGKPISVRPVTWLDLEKIKSWQMKKP